MQIHLHIGAHKTATTFIQTQLRIRASELAAAGLAAAPHSDVRKAASDRLDLAGRLGGAGLPLAQPAIALALKPLVAAQNKIRRLIVSEENLIGSMASVEGDAGMYPDVGSRLKCLLTALSGRDVKVFVSIRAYPDFLASVFAYQAGRKAGLDQDAFARRTQALRRDWPDVVGDVCEVAGGSNVTVWTYEGFAHDPGAVSDALTGEPGLNLFPAESRRLLPSLSRKGMAVMERVSPLLSTKERQRLSRVLSHFAFDPPDGKHQIFERPQADDLMGRYQSDIAAIERMGCTVIGARQAAELAVPGA